MPDMPYHFRRASVDDAAIVARHRRLMFVELGHQDHAKLDAMERQFTDWVRAKLESGEYLAWLAVNQDSVVAGVGLWIREWIINPNDLSGKEGYVGNVYTDPAHRRNGLARQLMELLIQWCGTNGISGLFLRPTEPARALYDSLGFVVDNAMYKRIKID